jgi:hypothetical protein
VAEGVSRGLRQFFIAHLMSGKRFVSMPSRVADDLWHEFILYTLDYKRFCRRAFGTFLHHTPAVVLSESRKSNEGLRRVWWYCCKYENIDPRHPNARRCARAAAARCTAAATSRAHQSMAVRRASAMAQAAMAVAAVMAEAAGAVAAVAGTREPQSPRRAKRAGVRRSRCDRGFRLRSIRATCTACRLRATPSSRSPPAARRQRSRSCA